MSDQVCSERAPWEVPHPARPTARTGPGLSWGQHAGPCSVHGKSAFVCPGPREPPQTADANRGGSLGPWGMSPWWLSGKESACSGRHEDLGSVPESEDPPGRTRQPTPAFLPEKSAGQEPDGPQSVGHKELCTAEVIQHVLETVHLWSTMGVLSACETALPHKPWTWGLDESPSPTW